MAGTPVTLEKDGNKKTVATPAEQVRLEFNGWKVVKSGKKATTENK